MHKEKMATESLKPKVGVGILILREGKTLLGKRKNVHAAGQWGSVGGHVEHLESLESAALREMKEEAGIEVENLRFLCVVNYKNDPKHYIDIGFVADWKSGEPEIREPDKLEEWRWFDLNDMPEPLFDMLPSYLEAYKTGKTFFDA
jgi:8-oxo-dGTP diphosphatase